MPSPRERLISAREAAGKSPEELADAAGISPPSYYDLEWVEGELEECLPLVTLQKLCAELRIRSSDLFADEPIAPAERIPPASLVAKIKEHLEETQRSISEFENKVGFKIRACLEDASSILTWDIDCLRYVCAELGVDWKLALP